MTHLLSFLLECLVLFVLLVLGISIYYFFFVWPYECISIKKIQRTDSRPGPFHASYGTATIRSYRDGRIERELTPAGRWMRREGFSQEWLYGNEDVLPFREARVS